MSNNKRKYSDYLFSKNSLISGFFSVFNVFGTYYTFNYSDTPTNADSMAIYSDWAIIGQDIQDTFDAELSNINVNA